MKIIENLQGGVIVLNETFEESLETFNYYLSEYGMEIMDDCEAKDWINGGETNAQLKELASDIASEHHTNMCENKNAWRYEV